MFKKWLENKEETWYLIGNIAVLAVFLLSFIWFLTFSLRIINEATTVPSAETAASSYGFNLKDFEKVKVLFDRAGKGFSVISEKEEASPPK